MPPPTISPVVESQGRHRYYALSGPETAYAVEALASLGSPAAAVSDKAQKELYAVLKVVVNN